MLCKVILNLLINTTTDCDVYISNAKSDEFRYCWQESQDNSGEEYSANVNEPISVTFDGSAINIPEISYAELLYSDYGIILSNENVDWTNDYAYALYESIKKTPLSVQGEGADNRSFSTWTITADFITDDISLSAVSDGLNVIIGEAAFVNANPKIAEVEGKRGIFFSNRLFKSVVRFISNNGSNQSIVEQMLSDRYGVSINVDDYLALTGEESTRFQDFQPEELVEIIDWSNNHVFQKIGVTASAGIKAQAVWAERRREGLQRLQSYVLFFLLCAQELLVSFCLFFAGSKLVFRFSLNGCSFISSVHIMFAWKKTKSS